MSAKLSMSACPTRLCGHLTGRGSPSVATLAFCTCTRLEILLWCPPTRVLQAGFQEWPPSGLLAPPHVAHHCMSSPVPPPVTPPGSAPAILPTDHRRCRHGVIYLVCQGISWRVLPSRFIHRNRDFRRWYRAQVWAHRLTAGAEIQANLSGAIWTPPTRGPEKQAQGRNRGG